MMCQACNAREASVQFTEVVGEQKHSSWLCADCAHTKGLYVSMDWEGGTRGRPSQLRRCQLCGSTIAAIRRSGRVGCPNCYEEFAEFIEPLLQRVHGRTRHLDSVDADSELLHLRAQLAQAVKREDFELAARLRDRLERLSDPGRT